DFPAPLGVKLSGSGPVDDWRGQINLDLGDTRLATTDLTLQLRPDQLAMTADSRVTPAPVLPKAFQPIEQHLQTIDLHLTTSMGPDLDKMHLDDLLLQSDLGTLKFQADTNLQTKTVHGSGFVHIPELNILQPLMGQDISGDARLDIRAKGPWSKPDLQLQAQGQELVFNTLHTQEAGLSLRPDLSISEDGKSKHLQLTGELQATSLFQEQALLLPGPLQATFHTGLDVDSRQVHLKSFRLNLPGMETTLHGQAEATGPFQAEITCTIDDVQNLPQFQDLALHSGAELNSSLRGNWREGRLNNEVGIMVSDLSGLPPQAADVLGSQVSLQAQTDLSPENILTMNSLIIKGERIDLQAQAELDVKTMSLQGTWKVRGPDLKVVKGLGLSGLIAVDGHVHGTVQDVNASLDLSIKELTAPGLKPSTLQAGFQGQVQAQKTKVDGALHLNLKNKHQDIQLLSGLQLSPDLLTLPDLQLTAPMTKLQAAMDYHIQEGVLRSDIDLEIQDLQWLQDFTPHAVQGGLSLAAEVDGPISSPNISAQGEINNLQVAEVKGEHLHFQAAIADLQTMQGRLEAQATNILLGSNRINRLHIQAQGDQGQAEAEMDLTGHLGHDVEVKTKALIRRENEVIRIALPQGRGHFAEMPFSWDEPFQATQSGDDVQLVWPGLHLGPGTLQLRAGTEKNAVHGTLQVNELDLAQLPLPAKWALNGTTDMQVNLSGTRTDPDLNFTLHAQKLQSQAGITQDLPFIDVQSAGKVSSREAQAQLSVQGGPEIDLTAELNLPLDLSLQPFQFQLGNSVSGQSQGRADLGHVFSSLPMDGQDVSGLLAWDISCSGSLPLPQVQGKIQLTDGKFENYQSGTLLQKLEGGIELQGNRAQIVRLQATDGEEGRIQASGDIRFDPGQDMTYALKAHMEKATLLRMEAATAAISGEIELQGNASGAAIQGDLKAFPVNVGIPDPAPSGLEGLTIISSEDASLPPDPENGLQPPSFAQNTTLDIHITIPGGLFIRGRGLDSEWEGDLRIQGPADKPLISGYVVVKRGHLNLLTKRFALDQGRVTFMAKHPPEPELDLTASTSANDLVAKVHITGRATEPSIELSSDPAMPRDEILARILFDRKLSQITPLQAVKLALAVRTLTSGGNGGLMSSLRQHVGLDELTIDSDPESSDTPGVTVGAGKYLNENVYFKVEKGLEGNDGRVVVNIRLTPGISLESRAGSEHQGMYITWSHSY
ncbi:MAG: translocation/assembly module TamB domain-containing protein, partial [Desulfovermiculus sp.]|nr:translocation/assembly module TamB domain-containing protein [Desulfovermiculus sp.]